MDIKISIGMPETKSFDEKLKEGASVECGLAGAMPLREYPLPRRVDHGTRDTENDNDDDDY